MPQQAWSNKGYVATLQGLAQIWQKPVLLTEIGYGSVAGNNRSPRPMWPAAFKRVVGVGAVDHDHHRAAFSNYGWWVDACTGGVQVFGPFPRFPPEGVTDAQEPFFEGWAIWSGTSFAAPKVSGEIAARLSTGHYASARGAASSLVNDPTRPHLPGLGTLLVL